MTMKVYLMNDLDASVSSPQLALLAAPDGLPQAIYRILFHPKDQLANRIRSVTVERASFRPSFWGMPLDIAWPAVSIK